MDLDGQAIERRDFPISRRGYEPAAVDSHLRAVAAAVAALRSELRHGETVGRAAGAQVQGIIDAAEAAAADIEREARARARDELAAARQEAARVRDDALAKANDHVSAVEDAAATMRSRLQEMEAKLESVTGTLLAGSTELTSGLGQLRGEMAALYDAAAGRAGGPSPAAAAAAPNAPRAVRDAPIAPRAVREAPSNGVKRAEVEREPPVPAAIEELPVASAPRDLAVEDEPAPARSADVDGARLIALNMALNGDSREQTDHYLAEHFDLADRAKLVDEVFGAIDG